MAIKKPHTALSQISIPMQKCLLRSSLHSATFAKLTTLHSVPHYEVIIAGRREESPTRYSLPIYSKSISSFPSFKIQHSKFKILSSSSRITPHPACGSIIALFIYCLRIHIDGNKKAAYGIIPNRPTNAKMPSPIVTPFRYVRKAHSAPFRSSLRSHYCRKERGEE